MKKVLLLVLVLVSTLSFAAEKNHMILASSNGSASFVDSNDEYKLSFNVTGGYYYALNSFVQIGGQGSYAAWEGLFDATYSLAPGVILNFALKHGDGLENSFFFQTNAGYMGHFGDSAHISEFYYNLQFGKRFALLPNVSYSPSIGLLHVPDMADPSYSFNFLQMTIHF